MKLKKGDEIMITAGKDKGRKGKIEKVFPKSDTVLVTGLNVYKRHKKRRDEKHPGGIISFSKPVNASNVMFLCPSCGQKSRIGYKNLKNEKVRVCRKCERTI